MKYIIFTLVACLLIPAVAFLSGRSARCKAFALTLLALSPALGSNAKLNFWSQEWYRGPDRGFEVTLTDLLVLGLAGGLLARGMRRITWLPTNSLNFLLLGALCCVSAIDTPVPLYSAFTIFKLARCALLYWVLVNCLTTRQDVVAVLRGWAVAGLLVALHAVWQKYGIGMYRVTGPFDHSNTLPPYVNLAIAPLLIRCMVDDDAGPLERTFTVTAVLGMIFAVVATFSRAGTFFCAAGFVTALAVGLVQTRRPRSLRIAAIFLLIATAGGIKAAPRIIERFSDAPHASEGARQEFNVAARLMADEHVAGVGVNAFSEVMSTNLRYTEHVQFMADERQQAGVAHHIYWLTAAELGYAGLALYLVIILRFLWACASAGLRLRAPQSTLALGLAIGMVALHLHGLFEWAFRITPVMYQFVMAGALAVTLTSAPSIAPSPTRRPARSRA